MRSSADRAPAAWRGSRGRLGWIVAAALTVALAGTTLLKNREPQLGKPEIVEFPLVPPEGVRFKSPAEFAVSPDGRHVAFVASSKDGSLLWLRSLAAIDPRPLPGTEGARNPFWSPDSRSIGFFADNQLKTVQANGRPAVTPLWPVETGNVAPSGTWGRTGVIVFGPIERDLYQINVNKGGTATPVTKSEGTNCVYRRPRFLQDGQHFLYSCNVRGKNEIRAGSLTSAETVIVGSFDSQLAYAARRVFFVRDGDFLVQALNEETLHLDGDPMRLAAQPNINVGTLPYSVSDKGLLVFLPSVPTDATLTWKNRSGRVVGVLGEPGQLGNLDLSPDGRRLAISKVTPAPKGELQSDIWLIDVVSGRATPLTDDPGFDNDPSWSPDGKYIVFNSSRLRPRSLSLLIRPSDGSGVDVPLVKSETDNFSVASWSRSGVLIFNAFREGNPANLWTLRMPGNSNPTPFLTSKHRELNAAFSPDGRWIAYQSNATGRYEVMVRPFPNKDPELPISHDGGMYPRWRGDGKELFFISPDGRMMAAGFDPAIGQPKGAPQDLFQTQIGLVGDNRPYAVDKDGQRFLLPIAPEQPVVVVTNWRALLDR